VPVAPRRAPAAPARNPYVTPELFRFFEELARNNRREWFQANKERYHAEVRDPLLAFVQAMGPALERVSRYVVADPRPVGGALFRIYRDTRFARDKTPYKTHAGVHFRHARAEDVHSLGYYLHLEPGNVFVVAGIWHPGSEELREIRGSIAAHPDRWKRASQDRGFRRHFELSGDTLTRTPRGFDPDHPLAADLRRKDYIGTAELSPSDAVRPDFPERFAALCAAASPFMAFLARSLGAPW
jgi:uncharacterized protein (TIGR02453 family)